MRAWKVAVALVEQQAWTALWSTQLETPSPLTSLLLEVVIALLVATALLVPAAQQPAKDLRWPAGQ